tara:strand:- start:3752 stop:4183 length:432 start_codon:yes stop_codon:yes gene_type:complete
METIRDIETQIQAHKRAKEFHHEKYLNNLQIIDDKIERIEKQMEKSKSSVKRDLLKRHIDWYEGEISRMDESIENITQKYDSEIERFTNMIESIKDRSEKEKKSFDYNIQRIRECCENRSAATMFQALQSVANALEIIKDEVS